MEKKTPERTSGMSTIEPLSETPTLDELVRAMRSRGDVVLLETQDENKAMLFGGMKASLSCRGDHCIISSQTSPVVHFKQNPWLVLKAFRKNYEQDWMAGYLGYDLKNQLEALESENPDPVNLPDLFMFVPNDVVVYHGEDQNPEWLSGGLFTPSKIETEAKKAPFTFSIDADDPAQKSHYLGIIDQALRDIAEGDYYEINLSRQLQGSFIGDPFELYHAMKKAGPVPFGAYLKMGRHQVCCASPERFLRKRGDQLLSEPIKGTAAVAVSENDNKVLAQALLDSEKNRAENLMIVDLVRHDFNRVCMPDSVRVPELFGIRRYPTVHQMVSKIEGRLRTDIDPVDAVAACFPMGSMTGAPKISAMQSIETLENYRRGIYSGAIGCFRPGGDFDFNVVIRTAICHEDKIWYSTGGAITADSDPAEEWEETVLKAQALMKGKGNLGC